jgi:CheY-like chemotaxis protein/MinD-like ATPase involved in chromosome partitioning or flagellar assembly
MSKRILIVDDDLESLKLISLMLERRGYKVISVHSGQQALLTAETEKPDLAILDIMMPGLDGIEVCQRMRSDPRTASIPVIMFTARTLVGDRVAGFHAGADDYLTKPIHPSELVARVEALLQRSKQTRAEAKGVRRARVIGVLGAKGGVGTSTVAVNLALALAERGEDSPGDAQQGYTSLVDLHPGLGATALLLGQAPRGGWEPLLERRVDALSELMIERQMVVYNQHLRYLSAPMHPVGQEADLPTRHVERVLTSLADNSDYLVLDLGSVLDRSIRQAVASCDVLLMVVEPGRLSMTLGRALEEKIHTLGRAPQDVRAVMVQRSSSYTGDGSGELETTLLSPLAAVLEPAPKVVRQSMEQGEPVLVCCSDSRLASQFRELSESLATGI